MKQILIAGAIALGMSTAALAQNTPPATPMQGTPPYTNSPAPATSDATSNSSMGDTNSTMAAPADKPMAGQANTPTDPSTTPPPKHHKKPQ